MTDEKKDEYTIKAVPTQTEELICKGELVYTDREVLLLLLTKVSNLEKKLVG